jgi:tripartite-type tricarboxylate transporter receptor subunit TctC
MKMRFSIPGAVLAAALATSAAAQSDYPSQTIELIVGYNAGGAVDTVTRAAAPFLEKHIGNGASIAVINRPGASGTVAAISVANAEPDGYTLMMYSYPALAAAGYGQEEQPYTLDDFDFLGTFTADPHNLFVLDDSEYESLEQMLAAAEEQPGEITVAAAGVGGAAHLALEVFQREAGRDFNYVPAAGGAGTMTQTLGGHVDAGVTTLSSLIPYLREGDVRILATFGAERSPLAEEVPTAREQGVDMTWGAIRGLMAPAGIPDDIRTTLEEAVEATLNDPEFIALAEKQGIPLFYVDGAAFREIAASDVERLDRMWEEQPWK